VRCHNVHIRFHKDWLRHSEADRGRFIDTQTPTEHGDLISIHLFFQNRENRLTIPFQLVCSIQLAT
jgi:hypothetical protein